MIRTRQLTRVFGTRPALAGLDLEVPEGALVGLIGPNGAGKSTLLRVLATLLPATAGDAWIGGRSVTADPEAVRPLIGYMPDEPVGLDAMGVSAYLHFFAAAYRIEPPERATLVGEVLELTDLAGESGTRIEQLSRGLQQRVALARALVHRPPVLLLDEPAAGLDPRGRLEVRELLAELARMGRTILVASHLTDDLSPVCDQLVVIDDGRTLFSGTPDQARAAVEPPPLELRLASAADRERAATAIGDVVGGEARRVTVRVPEDDVAALVRRVVEAGVDVVGISRREVRLDDVYLALTGGVRSSD